VANFTALEKRFVGFQNLIAVIDLNGVGFRRPKPLSWQRPWLNNRIFTSFSVLSGQKT